MDSILFDLDGTMWDSTKTAAVCWREIADKYPQIKDEITPERLKTLYGLPLEEIAVKLFESVSEDFAIKVMEECVVAQCPFLKKQGGILLGSIEETLKALAPNYSLCIVSNCKSGYIESFLEAHHLGQYFKDFACPGDTGMLKAENIKLVMKRNNFTSSIYVGDTDHDGVAAREAGIPFVFARYGFGETKDYDYVIDSFDALISLMKKLEKQ